MFGLASPAHPGSMIDALIISFIFSSLPSSYAGMRLFELQGGTNWRRRIALQAIAIPFVLYVILLSLKTALREASSANALTRTDMELLSQIWMFSGLPLTGQEIISLSRNTRDRSKSLMVRIMHHFFISFF